MIAVVLVYDCAPVPLQEGVDMLVATPGRVTTLLEAEALSLEDCRAVVLDEVCGVPFLIHRDPSS